MKNNDKWPKHLRGYKCSLGDQCFWWHGPTPSIEVALKRKPPMKDGKVHLIKKYDNPKKGAPARPNSAPPGPVAAATEQPKKPSRSASQRARRRAARDIAAAGEAVSDDDISEPPVSLCRAWASGLGCQGGPQCPGLQYHKSPSPDELFAAQHNK